MPADLSPPADSPQPVLSTQLDRLFEVRRPAGSRASHAQVGEAVGVSARYIGQLRRGERDRPSPAVLARVADFFRVDPAYFTDQAVAAVVGAQLDVLEALAGPELHLLHLGADPDLVKAFDAAAGLLRQARDTS